MKRSPLQRKQPLRAKPLEEKSSLPLLRKKKCAACKESYRPFSSLQKWCSPECGAVLAMSKLERQKLNKAKEDRAVSKAKREALKTIPQLKKEAQREFNRFIRARDRARGYGCISSGRPLDWGGVGGLVDAGHYRSTGAADHLRFNEDNCHAQSVRDNRDLGGNAVAYRIGLIARIGLERVEALEANSTPIKWTREGLREIRDTYRRKARELEKQIDR